MDASSRLMPVEKTGMFSGLVLDYLSRQPQLDSLYSHPVSMNGVAQAMQVRSAFPTNRVLLHQLLTEAYAGKASPAQQQHIDALLSHNTFTICTAHQCNLFTGYLYFIYKILHVIRLAHTFKNEFPEQQFVPVYYMGSEDNDLAELGQFQVDGVAYSWQTRQTGAVGRMKVDKPLLQLIAQLEGQLGVHPYGASVTSLLRACYQEGVTIASATFELVNRLFQDHGLLVIMADDARWKAAFQPIMMNDLFQHDPERLVSETGSMLEKGYKVQVNPREINLFYMSGGIRERIIRDKHTWKVDNTDITFDKETLMQELNDHPERFSPNVVLRALYQETILPNIAFVGGGAELAYWLELRSMFTHFQVPYPMLILRNSFLIYTAAQEKKLQSFQLSVEDLFLSEYDLMNRYVALHSTNDVSVTHQQTQVEELFRGFKDKAGAIDPTLVQHLQAMEARLQKQINEAGKKLLRAEKRRFEVQKAQLLKLREQLFPKNKLQERYDNFLPYYAQYGPAFLEALWKHSPGLDQAFILLSLNAQ